MYLRVCVCVCVCVNLSFYVYISQSIYVHIFIFIFTCYTFTSLFYLCDVPPHHPPSLAAFPVNLAIAMKLVAQDKSVGLLDADVYGPSIPRMMNLKGQPSLNEKNFMQPMINYDIKW